MPDFGVSSFSHFLKEGVAVLFWTSKDFFPFFSKWASSLPVGCDFITPLLPLSEGRPERSFPPALFSPFDNVDLRLLLSR